MDAKHFVEQTIKKLKKKIEKQESFIKEDIKPKSKFLEVLNKKLDQMKDELKIFEAIQAKLNMEL